MKPLFGHKQMKADKGFFSIHILTMHIHAKGLDTALDTPHKQPQLKSFNFQLKLNDADANHYPHWEQFLQRFLPIHNFAIYVRLYFNSAWSSAAKKTQLISL